MVRWVVAAFCLLLPATTRVPAAEPIAIGSRLELLVDDFLIDSMDGATLRLHQPEPQEVVITHDEPWEGNLEFHYALFPDGDLARMYYRAWSTDPASGKPRADRYICYAESEDGLHWRKPHLGLVDFNGSKDNNIVLRCSPEIASNGAFAVFKDGNPQCEPDALYKAVVFCHTPVRALYAYKSPDAIHWTAMSESPIITKGVFDSTNLAFWDSLRCEYRAYHRDINNGIRDIRTETSVDFLHWSEPVYLEYPGAPTEDLYTNQILPYFRAPHIFVGFPKRFVPQRTSPAGHPLPGVSDGVFMTSRDGRTFHRWTEAFIRPGPQPDRWVNRNNATAWGILEVESHLEGAPKELALYSTEGYYRGAATRLRRYRLRMDGFVSVNAPLSGGEFTTRPLTFVGGRLHLNCATSAAGSIRVEIQDGDGLPIEGHTLEESVEFYGDSLGYVVTWNGGDDVSQLAGRPVRLRFVLRDADVFAMQFR